jgi:outer membrane receptor for Fe3+-dicitrate
MVSAVKTHYLQFRDITMKIKLSLITLACLSAWQQSAIAETSEMETAKDDVEIESIQVIGRSVSYANNESTQDMVKQQSTMTSILAAIDNLPGVLINEGDTFGSDDWSTTVSIRGFQISLDEQQVGITVDGIANGNSNYGGGAKANRYIDTENLGFIQVSQGTADIASRSNEALGGTLNFTSIDPTEDEHLLTSITLGDFDAKRYFMRYNSGEILGNTRLWFSASNQTNTDWVNQSAENKKLHIASKFISELSNDLTLTGYFSYDDAEEDNYQRVSKAQFETNPESDGLLAEWTGIPHIDQVYRKGWSTLRENTKHLSILHR